MQSWGDDSVDEALAIQAWRPEFSLRHSHKMPGMGPCICNPSAGDDTVSSLWDHVPVTSAMRKKRQEIPFGWLNWQSPGQTETLIHKIRWRAIEDILTTHLHVCTGTHTQKYTWGRGGVEGHAQLSPHPVYFFLSMCLHMVAGPQCSSLSLSLSLKVNTYWRSLSSESQNLGLLLPCEI